jgi:PAS domain-containing protein
LLETIMFLLAGSSVSLIVSRIEYARKQAAQERMIASSRTHELEAILATIADGIIVYDTRGHVRHANPAARAFNPYTEQASYLVRPFPERFSSFLPRDEQGKPFTPENLPVMRALRGEVLTGELAVDTLMRAPDGEDRLSSVSGAPIRDEAGNISGAVIVMRDVTERRRIAREAAERARQLSTIFETVPDAITVFDCEGRIIQMNESAHRLLARYVANIDTTVEERQTQVQPRDPQGVPLTSATSPIVRILRGETLTGEQAQTVIVRTFEGEDLWLSIAGAPLYDDEGNISGAVAVTRDLTTQQRTAGRTRAALQALLQFAEALVQPGDVERLNVK